MAKFDNARIGNRVWDIIYGGGEIVEIDGCQFRVYYKNIKYSYWYKKDGTLICLNIKTLFWNEVKLPTEEEDKKPFDLVEFLRENLKPKEFVNDMLNYYLYFDYDSSSWHSSYNEYCERMDIYFELIGCNITEELNNNMISPKQLRDAYKKLGWL